jgi:hypothetical protein
MRRLRFLFFHAGLGFLTPLLYSLIISAELPTVARQPVGDLELTLSFWALPVVGVQFLSGWSVLSRRPWRTLTRFVRGRIVREPPL